MPPSDSPHSGDDPKRDLRAAARARRDAAHAVFGARIGPVLTANFMAAFSLGASDSVAGYATVNNEVDVVPLLAALAARGHATALPAVAARGQPLVFRSWRPGDALIPGYMNIPEPAPEAPEIVPAVVLVPLLAYDVTGHRLGYGGGYYDRTLAALRASGAVRAIGVAFSAQAVDSLPGAAHDQRLDAVITELGVTRFGKAGA